MIGFDTETYPIEPGILAPRLVCGAFSDGALLDADATVDRLREIIRSGETLAVANGAYDFAVVARRVPSMMQIIFGAYKAGQVHDILVAEKLHAIAHGTLGLDPRTMGRLKSYSLENVIDLLLYEPAIKNGSTWRLRFAELDGIPIEEWPQEARDYAMGDATWTLRGAQAQLGLAPRMVPHDWTESLACSRCGVRPGGDAPRGCPVTRASDNLHDLPVQVYASWCLHLGACWGLRAHGPSVAALKSAALTGRIAAQSEFQARGFLRGDGTEHQAAVKRAVAIAYGAFETCAECTDGRVITTEQVQRRRPKNKTPESEVFSALLGTNGEVISVLETAVTPTEPYYVDVVKSNRSCKTCDGTGLVLPLGVPRTDKGAIRIGRDPLIESGDSVLMAYAQSQEDDKVLDTYIPFLESAIDRPVTLSPNNPLETGRVSYRDKSQVLPRAVSAHLSAALRRANAPITGVRDCFVARPGYVYFSVDYTGGELVTFAEACVARVGYSKMGQALNQGLDVHGALAASMLGLPYDEYAARRAGKRTPADQYRADRFRQAAKPQNFGNPGGMGEVRLVLQQRAQGPDTPHESGPVLVDDGDGNFVPGYKGLRFCLLTGHADRCGATKIESWKDRPCPKACLACVQAAQRGREAWFRQWPEARPYLKWHGENVDRGGSIRQLYSGRVRGGVEFTSAANGDFQGLLADIAKRALIRVVTEQYTDRESQLYGSRVIVFAHDEMFGEAPESIAHDVCVRISDIMIDEFRKGCHNHQPACKVEPALSRRWVKSAKPVYRDGRLIPWEDR